MAKIALLIGVSEYEPELPPLPNAVNDVEAMQRVLLNPEMGGFDKAEVLKNPQRQVMEDAIYELYANRQKEDLLLLYFSGHGITEDTGDFYFSTRFTRKDGGKLRPTTAVAARNVHLWMNQSKSRRMVVILDCCFSAAFAKGLTAKDSGTINLEQHLGGEGRAILTAATSTQYAFEQEGLELSVYTHYLVEGIENGAADKDGDGLIAVDELHGYASSKVREASPAMTPEFYPFKDGYRIFLAKSPKDDPKLKYRQEVERRINQGKFNVIARRLLNSLRLTLNIAPEVADAIEAEVQQPYREYQRKLEEYEATLMEAIEDEGRLSERTLNDLRDYQQHLGLRDEDVAPIEKRLIGQEKDPTPNPSPQARRGEINHDISINSSPQTVRGDINNATSINSSPQTGRGEVKSGESLANQFEFDVVTVNGQGKIINSRRGKAEFFTEDLGNGVILDMVAIPGGQFFMGSPENELERRDNESPQHKVTIQPFFLGKYPVTQSQWKVVAALPKVKIDLNSDPSHFKGANRPVEQVSWNDAIEFCARLSHKTGKIYRLPSEAEWEYACRAGTTTPFYFGETISTELANYNSNYIYGSGSKGKYLEQTTDVGKFPPNAFGLYDMHGNVWEWCQDGWHKNYIDAPTDGSVWANDNDNRMLRGSSWFGIPRYCRSAFRLDFYAGDRKSFNGFRVACSAA
ncbi:hypothetical protein Cylst_2032 [Cylindrospermum stagnale PCC 7417]|uniref:Uncharacterized protein n=1 Tax=Cylindrospermum stagnale PCC 7417 TaxID=56107 RepID=K9WWV9_9NOST|nr:SUMF1/EgtB/PvdO family nonheme iron enzyme [Cylindrospermum stagnale]AFZ24276.1 hypothetical protein Cylst_2032 [Cylindrospermum stagnale PCC 7417]